MTGKQKIQLNTLLQRIKEVAILASEINKDCRYAIEDIQFDHDYSSAECGYQLRAQVRLSGKFIDEAKVEKKDKRYYDNYERWEYKQDGVTVYSMVEHKNS